MDKKIFHFKNRNKKKRAEMKEKRVHHHGDGKKTIIVCGNTSDQGDSFWETKIDEVGECSKAPKNVEVKISPIVKVKIEALMEEYKSIEWLAYLLGEGYSVKDIFIPEQTVTGGSVSDIKCDEFNELPIIGVMHSHHGMGSFFSQTDDSYINQNHDISIVVSKDGTKGQVRWKTPCGAVKIVDAKISLDFDVNFDSEEFIENVKTKIKKKTYATVAKNWNRVYYGHPYYPQAMGQPWNRQEESTEEWNTGRDSEIKNSSDSSIEDFLNTLDEEERKIIAELEGLENMPLS